MTTPQILVPPRRVNAAKTVAQPQIVERSKANVSVVYIPLNGGRPGPDDRFHIRGRQYAPDGTKFGTALLRDDMVFTAYKDVNTAGPVNVTVVSGASESLIVGTPGDDKLTDKVQ